MIFVKYYLNHMTFRLACKQHVEHHSLKSSHQCKQQSALLTDE